VYRVKCPGDYVEHEINSGLVPILYNSHHEFSFHFGEDELLKL
jgi:hypothetical protein